MSDVRVEMCNFCDNPNEEFLVYEVWHQDPSWLRRIGCGCKTCSLVQKLRGKIIMKLTPPILKITDVTIDE